MVPPRQQLAKHRTDAVVLDYNVQHGTKGRWRRLYNYSLVRLVESGGAKL